VIRDYRFRIQQVLIGKDRRYQVRVGMYGDTDIEFIPAYRSAYAKRVQLKDGHETPEEAHREQDALMKWLQETTARRA
jgi:hypothetical protein